MGLRAKERKTMGTFSVDAKDTGKGKLENEINQCLGGLPTRKILNNNKRQIVVNKDHDYLAVT